MNPIQATFYIRVDGSLAEKAQDPKSVGLAAPVFDHFYEGSPSTAPYYELVFKKVEDAQAYQSYLVALTFTNLEKVKILENFIQANFELDEDGMYLSVPHGTDVFKNMHPERMRYIRSIMENK